MCLSCLQYGISFGNKKPANVERDYIVLLSNLIEEGTVQCIVRVIRVRLLTPRPSFLTFFKKHMQDRFCFDFD